MLLMFLGILQKGLSVNIVFTTAILMIRMGHYLGHLLRLQRTMFVTEKNQVTLVGSVKRLIFLKALWS